MAFQMGDFVRVEATNEALASCGIDVPWALETVRLGGYIVRGNDTNGYTIRTPTHHEWWVSTHMIHLNNTVWFAVCEVCDAP